ARAPGSSSRIAVPPSVTYGSVFWGYPGHVGGGEPTRNSASVTDPTRSYSSVIATRKQFPDSPQVAPMTRVWPPISVVMPVLNEERHLREAVRQVLSQQYE